MRSRRQGIEEHENTERWLVSYADFITLLFAFFVVMYSISSVSESKYRVLSDTMTEAFKTPPKSEQPIQIGEPSRQLTQTPSETVSPLTRTTETPEQQYQEQMQDIASQVSEALHNSIAQGLIKVKRERLWVEVEMNTRMLFPSGSAELTDEAIPTLSKLAEMLRRSANHIDVEGHTDNVPISNMVFPSNWELSAARAASVVHLFSRYGVDPQRLSAIGYGEYRPLTGNDTEQGRLRNRRVSLIILAHRDARRMSAISGESKPVQAPILQK